MREQVNSISQFLDHGEPFQYAALKNGVGIIYLLGEYAYIQWKDSNGPVIPLTVRDGKVKIWEKREAVPLSEFNWREATFTDGSDLPDLDYVEV